jgi:hypothetical protein
MIWRGWPGLLLPVPLLARMLMPPPPLPRKLPLMSPLMLPLRLTLVLILLSITLSACQRSHPALRSLPAHMLWAWERVEDLRWLPPEVGVAFVASSVTLEGSRTQVARRANPLYVRPDTRLMPVVHVDASWRNPPELNAAQQQAIVEQVLRVAQPYRVVQLDFEVRRSQRPFLKAVLAELRRRLPPETALSMTALASWCMGDYWLDGIAADEIVPMLFRMGRDQQNIRQHLNHTGHFPRYNCQAAVGFASDEPVVPIAGGRRYYFSAQPWRAAEWQRIQTSLRPANGPGAENGSTQP